jgi:uncharacterized protein (UPF0303 family)
MDATGSTDLAINLAVVVRGPLTPSTRTGYGWSAVGHHGDAMNDDKQDLLTLIAGLEQQEQRLQFTRFDNDDAWRLGCLVVALAQERQLAITVDIRRHGQQLFHAALPGTAPENDSWIERKAAVVNRFNAASYLVGRRLSAEGRTLDESYGVDPKMYATHGGSFPLRIRDVGVIGTVTVSGLPQADDHALVIEAIDMFLTDETV